MREIEGKREGKRGRERERERGREGGRENGEISESETRKREDGGVREKECMNGRSVCNMLLVAISTYSDRHIKIGVGCSACLDPRFILQA